MTIRTFRQHGQAYGTIPAELTATIDGIQIFSGAISTLDEPWPQMPVPPGTKIGGVLFSWENDVTFSGTQLMELTVTGSPLLLTYSQANYVVIPNPGTPPPEYVVGPDYYSEYYSYELNGVRYTDPLSNEVINGESVSRPENASLKGQWWWRIPAGGTFSATVNILPGVLPPTE